MKHERRIRVDRAILHHLRIHTYTEKNLTGQIMLDLARYAGCVSQRYIKQRIFDMLLTGTIKEYPSEQKPRLCLAANQITVSQIICNILSHPDIGGTPVLEDQIILHITENMEFTAIEVQLGIDGLLNEGIIKREGYHISLIPKENNFFVPEEHIKSRQFEKRYHTRCFGATHDRFFFCMI